MNPRLVVRALWLSLVALVVVHAAVFLTGFATGHDLRLFGADVAVDEGPKRSLSAEYTVEPLFALLTWAVLALLALAALSRLSRRRRA